MAELADALDLGSSGLHHGGSTPPPRTIEIWRLRFIHASFKERDLRQKTEGGCSSVVERHVANVNVVGSKPITRSITPPI